MSDDIHDYGLGWAFLKGGGMPGGCLLPDAGGDLREWIKGYAAALADYDPTGDAASIEAALRNDGVEGDLLEKLLLAAEAELADESGEWIRWPSVPVRHSVDAVHARDERIAEFSGLLDDEEAPRGWTAVEAGFEVPGAIIV